MPATVINAPIERFDQLGLSFPLLRRLSEAGHETPSHIQSACIPLLLAGRDLLAHTHIGTGRTLAFVLPLLHRLDLRGRQPQVLVLTAADQTSLHVSEVFQNYARYLDNFHVVPIYHQSAAIQARQMQRGTQVIIGTPRRLLHHMEEHGLDLAGVGTVVLDETDEMLRQEFGEDIRDVLGRLPGRRQTAIFTAAMSKELRGLARAILREPTVVHGIEKTPTPHTVRQRHWRVGNQSKLNALARLIEVEPDFDAALVFVHDGAGAADLAEKLKARGYAAVALDSKLPPELRATVAAQLDRGEVDLVIATDNAAHSIMLDRITHLISYDMPCDAASHTHRIGHIGQSGHRTTAVLLVTPLEMGMLHSLERATQQTIPELELPERSR